MQHGVLEITGEEVFQVPAEVFGISADSTGYTLKWSPDGGTFSDVATVAANANQKVTDNCEWFRYKCSGLGSTAKVKVVF